PRGGGVVFGAGCAAVVLVVVAAGAAAAFSPHSALRKSFHFMPLSVLASFAALYFALHSCSVIALAGSADAVSTATVAAANERVAIFGSMARSLLRQTNRMEAEQTAQVAVPRPRRKTSSCRHVPASSTETVLAYFIDFDRV